jgi:methionine aminotransferase
VFTVNTPAQFGLARYMADPAPYLAAARLLPAQARSVPRGAGQGTRFRLLPCEGTYFQVVEYSAISEQPEAEFAQWLTREIGVTAIPMSAFYDAPIERRKVRFCFAKKDETLADALARLSRL